MAIDKASKAHLKGTLAEHEAGEHFPKRAKGEALDWLGAFLADKPEDSYGLVKKGRLWALPQEVV